MISACAIVAVLNLNSAIAEPVSLTCEFDDPNLSDRMKVEFNVEAATLRVASEPWELLGADQKVLTGRATFGKWPMSLMIDRETGKFWKVVLGTICVTQGCTKVALGESSSTGRCFKSF